MSLSNPADDLAELRSHIDEIDADIIELLARRFALTRQVGLLKAQSGMVAVDAKREAQQNARYSDLATQHHLHVPMVQAIFRIVIDEVVAHHETLALESTPTAHKVT